MPSISPSTRRGRRIASTAAKLSLALDIPVRFSQADDSGVSWLDRSIRKNPFCLCLNRRHVICRRCASTSYQFEQKKSESTKTARVFCISGAVKLVAPVFVEGMFLGVLSCGPLMREKPKHEGFYNMLARLKKGFSLADQRRLWRCYAAIPYVREARIRALEELLPRFVILPASIPRESHHSNVEPQVFTGCLVDRALQFIRRNKEGNITSEIVAQSLNVSPSYLSRKFHDVVGEPIHVYVARARIEVAKALLVDSSKKISEVGLLSGFNSLAAFNRWFHKLTGCSPHEFRNESVMEVRRASGKNSFCQVMAKSFK